MGPVRSICQLVAIAAACISVTVYSPAFADCQLLKLGTLPLEADADRPYVRGQINGQEMFILIDTGATHSLIWGGAAARAGLRPVQANARMMGISGESRVQVVAIDELKIGDFTVRNKRWPVFGDREATDDNFGMLLGSDFLSKMDVEFDLANQKIILWEPRDCKTSSLAYWSKEFLLAELSGSHQGWFETDVIINGRKIRALLDTGATLSVISRGLARSLGFDEHAPDVKVGPELSGVGENDATPSYIARFDTFVLGDLTVKNARLVVADLEPVASEAETGTRIKSRMEFVNDLVIGADFFRANHVFVSNSQGRLYFTYNGGTIFQIEELMEKKEQESGEDGKQDSE